MQWSNIETRISTRRSASASRSVQSSPKRSTSAAKSARKASTGRSMRKATRMKNLPVAASSNCAASVMSPPFAASRVATAATIPGRLSHRSVSTCSAISPSPPSSRAIDRRLRPTNPAGLRRFMVSFRSAFATEKGAETARMAPMTSLTPIVAAAVELEAGSVIPVVLCGGSGTRLWPLSRRTTPSSTSRSSADASSVPGALERLSDPLFAAPDRDQLRRVALPRRRAGRRDRRRDRARPRTGGPRHARRRRARRPPRCPPRPARNRPRRPLRPPDPRPRRLRPRRRRSRPCRRRGADRRPRHRAARALARLRLHRPRPRAPGGRPRPRAASSRSRTSRAHSG